ncbi:hypothetical protein [Myxosarcina sp. GI1(2024)]
MFRLLDYHYNALLPEIQQWLWSVHDVEASYWTVHKTVRYQLKSKLKVPRPINLKQEPGAVENFKKNCQN